MAPQKKRKGKENEENEENEQGPRNKAPEIVEKAYAADAVSVDSFQAVDAFCVLRAVFLESGSQFRKLIAMFVLVVSLCKAPKKRKDVEDVGALDPHVSMKAPRTSMSQSEKIKSQKAPTLKSPTFLYAEESFDCTMLFDVTQRYSSLFNFIQCYSMSLNVIQCSHDSKHYWF